MVRPTYDWLLGAKSIKQPYRGPCHIHFTAYGRKPRKHNRQPRRSDLPGLVIGPAGTYATGTRVWRCYFDRLLSN